MVIEKGFKQTDLGSIPENWNITFLDELIDKTRSIRYGIVQPGKFDPQGRYLVRGQDYSFGWAGPDTLFRVSPSIEEKYKNARLKSGDLVLTIVGASTGHVETVPNWLDGANITQTTARIPIDESKANSGYCKQYLQSSYGWKIVLNFMKGAAQPGLNIGDIRIFKIIIPPLPEQTAIANALSDMDALIAQTEKLIEKKKAIKQGVMQELLKPKEGWVTKKLGEIANCFAGGTPSTFNRDFWGDKIPWLPSGRVKNNIIKPIENEITITDLGLSSSAAKMIKPNSILIAITGATCGNIGLLTFNAAANQSVVAIEQNDEFDSVLVYYILLTMRDDILRLQTGSAQGGVNLKSVKSLEVIIPKKIEEQNEISQILWDFDKEIESYNQKLTKLKLQKQGMMQALLTGKIRLV